MKKFYTNIAVALMAVFTMTALTSCDRDSDIAYDLDASRFMTNESSDAARLERIGKAILQATTADLKNMGTIK